MIGRPEFPNRLRYQAISDEAEQLLANEGESGRFEFKQTAEAVDAKVLVAAANTVVLEGIQAGYMTILVGVKENPDPVTGLVRGEVIGLTKMNDPTARRNTIDQARSKIQSRAQETKPVPVGLHVIEENVDADFPFLRLQVYPTRAPHYTNKGERIVRAGASTRALTDEELLELYLDREAEVFRTRFSGLLSEVTNALADLSRDVGSFRVQVTRDLHEAADAAGMAGAEAADAASMLRDLEMRVEKLPNADEIIAWLEVTDAKITQAKRVILRQRQNAKRRLRNRTRLVERDQYN